MSWVVLTVLVVALGGLALVQRRHAQERLSRALGERAEARSRGSHAARLQYPHVDLTRCLGCGTCVAACPEEGVLDLVHGQAAVVHGARCVGHGRCAAECPTGAISLTLADLASRRDIPALDERLEAPGTPGLFLAGEVTGFALIRTAITHGTSIAAEVARRRGTNGSAAAAPTSLDLCIVGAGPAGLACSLEAKARGLSFVTLEQEELGGTVAKYPRRKLVMTQPVELPLVGRLDRDSYEKEELTELWERVAREQALPIRTGVRFTGLAREADGFRVRTEQGDVSARNVCLALGRRGSPRKLGVPGEELAKVAYGLVDARSYRGRRVLVVGGGDSALEAAVGLAEQPGTEVTLSYRREAFFRVKARNEKRLSEAVERGRLRVLHLTEVASIEESRVLLRQADGELLALPNDDVFVLAGGVPPFRLLEESGVSFDPEHRPQPVPLVEQGSGLRAALRAAFVLSLATLAWAAWFHRYYLTPWEQRPASELHELLRPSRGIGLALGLAAALSVGANLAYLLRRARRRLWRWGSLRRWMTVHLVTGISALLLALLHAGMAPRQTVGGHALSALLVLVVTGAVGRYFYAFVPRAANGRELALDEVRGELAALAGAWERDNPTFGERVRRALDALTATTWERGLARRALALVRAQLALRRTLRRLRAEGRAEGVPEDQLASLLGLARRAQRVALMAAHYEELRGLLSSWRWLHRWTALLMVLLVVLHVLAALRYSSLLG